MRTQQHPLYSLTSRHFFEPIDRLTPDRSDYLESVLALLPDGWNTLRSGPWFECAAPNHRFPAQGWKIHVSATTHNAREVLAAVVPVLARDSVTFKFACDRRLLWLLNSKRWDRGGSGKFVTVYPRDDEHFRQLIAALHEATRGLVGPYILSDRRYKDSACVHYRYGSLLRTGERDRFGRQTSTIVGPDGTALPDMRVASFSPPAWTTDPFAEDDDDDQEAGTLSGGRYEITSVLAYSNSGGVYVALDRSSGAEVVIKEARPNVSWTSEHDDARALLRKEYRLLRKLEASGVAVRPIDYFTDWEHEFLVEERLPGVTLGTLPSRRSILLRTRPSDDDFAVAYAGFRDIFARLCEIVDTVHRHGIVFCDLSPHNVMYDEETGRLTAIDFEAAYEPGIDIPTTLATEGFVPADEAQSVESDVYALGAIMLHAVFNYASLLQLSPASVPTVVADLCRNARLPHPVRDAIARAMCPDKTARATVREIADALRANDAIAGAQPDPPWDGARARALLDRTLAYIESSADPERADRLFPACFRMFETNPMGLWYGATGTAAALRRVTGTVPPTVLAWIDAHGIDPAAYAPGLTVGMAGIAWALLELEREERALNVLAQAQRHARLAESCDLGVGLAGWGMTCLRFFRATGDEAHLARARDAGAAILERAEADDAGRRFWTASDGVHIGLLHGQSGIALFLLRLGQATGEERLVAAGRSALEFDLAQAQATPDGGSTFTYRTNYPYVLLPYWAYGSAGIGAVLVRYLGDTGADELRGALDAIVLDAERKYTVLSGKQYGLAGIGGFNLDAYAVTGEERFLRAARRAFDGIALHAVERDGGVAFSGDFQGKISCDYATGSAGVAVFLDRLLTGRDAELMLDGAR
jgi:tRNA A-37 threonylcarbamoyl transferase component Bud32